MRHRWQPIKYKIRVKGSARSFDEIHYPEVEGLEFTEYTGLAYHLSDRMIGLWASYTITHVPSGYAIADAGTERKARHLLRVLGHLAKESSRSWDVDRGIHQRWPNELIADVEEVRQGLWRP